MKTLAIFTIFVLVFGTASTSLVSDAYAQNDPNILLRIAEQADKQIKNQLERSYGNSIPSDIEDLYDQGHNAVESLEESLPDNVEQAREDFLTAMKLFQQISKMTSSYTTEAKVTASDVSDRDLKSELNRLHKYFQSLKSVSEKQKTGIELSEIQRLFILANEQIDSGDNQGATETINEIKSLITSTKKHIRDYSSDSASDRVKEFILNQLEKIQKILDKADSTDEIIKANDLIAEIEFLISEDDVSGAKQKFGELNKIVKIIKKSIR
jgi:hypothetical protein